METHKVEDANSGLYTVDGSLHTHITKNYKVVVKKLLTETNIIIKANKEPSTKKYLVILIDQKLLIVVKAIYG
jgi:hypothetical protein